MISTVLRRRLVILILVVLLIWQLHRYFPDIGFFASEEIVLRPSGAPVLAMVFYEALCPDSKNFILKQLQPAYEKAPDLIEVQFIPFGKATMHVNPDGSLTFDCQHGVLECQANMYHACAIEAVEDPKLRLDIISCMIRDNHNPKEAMQKCVREYKTETSELIQKCFDSPHGAELLKLHGEATSALRPSVSFIPTITLDGSQGRQASILKNFFGEVCKLIAGRGPIPDICA